MKKFYPLLDNALTKTDIKEGIKVLKSGQLTSSKIVKKFEEKFAKYIGSQYSLMTNSGSSANLLAIAAACNPLNSKRLKAGDEVLVPAICWSTSVWPLVLYNLKPIFVDIDIKTLNLDIKEVKKKISKKTKAIMCVNLLGMSTNMQELKNICIKNKLYLIEDTCEALGAKYNKKYLGTFGKFGTFSFYYSHQITCGEGGMLVTDDKYLYNIAKTLRAHGWSRDTIFHKYYSKKYNKIDSRFLFINSGFNLRPLEISAAIAMSQLKKLKYFIKIRDQNRKKIIQSIKKNSQWNNQFYFFEPKSETFTSWFGLGILINKKYQKKRDKFLKYLENKGVENRPIISGDFTQQPATKLYKLVKNEKFYYANIVQKSGFFIGLQTRMMNEKSIKKLTNLLLDITKL